MLNKATNNKYITTDNNITQKMQRLQQPAPLRRTASCRRRVRRSFESSENPNLSNQIVQTSSNRTLMSTKSKLARKSMSLGNLDTIEEWPENQTALKRGLSKKLSKISRLLSFSHRPDDLKKNQRSKPVITRGLEEQSVNTRNVQKVKGQLRKIMKKLSKPSIDGKKTPILSQKEIIIKRGITIWEEDLNMSTDSADFFELH